MLARMSWFLWEEEVKVENQVFGCTCVIHTVMSVCTLSFSLGSRQWFMGVTDIVGWAHPMTVLSKLCGKRKERNQERIIFKLNVNHVNVSAQLPNVDFRERFSDMFQDRGHTPLPCFSPGGWWMLEEGKACFGANDAHSTWWWLYLLSVLCHTHPTPPHAWPGVDCPHWSSHSWTELSGVALTGVRFLLCGILLFRTGTALRRDQSSSRKVFEVGRCLVVWGLVN